MNLAFYQFSYTNSSVVQESLIYNISIHVCKHYKITFIYVWGFSFIYYSYILMLQSSAYKNDCDVAHWFSNAKKSHLILLFPQFYHFSIFFVFVFSSSIIIRIPSEPMVPFLDKDNCSLFLYVCGHIVCPIIVGGERVARWQNEGGDFCNYRYWHILDDRGIL